MTIIIILSGIGYLVVSIAAGLFFGRFVKVGEGDDASMHSKDQGCSTLIIP